LENCTQKYSVTSNLSIIGHNNGYIARRSTRISARITTAHRSNHPAHAKIKRERDCWLRQSINPHEKENKGFIAFMLHWRETSFILLM